MKALKIGSLSIAVSAIQGGMGVGIAPSRPLQTEGGCSLPVDGTKVEILRNTVIMPGLSQQEQIFIF